MQTSETAAPAEPRLASTVIVARDAPHGGVEVVLTQRHEKLRFMGGMYVFPGGAVAEADQDESIASHAPPAWPRSLSPERDWAHAIAGVRETFEEAGLLLGTEGIDPARLREMREHVLAGADFVVELAQAGIKLDLSRLVPLIRWVTPRSEPIRFDTRFYVAPAPAQQIAEHDSRESVALVWLSPSAALEDATKGTIALSSPTRLTLAEIADVTSVADLIARALASHAPSVEPMIHVIDGARMILFPGDPEHPQPERVLKGRTRAPF